MNCRRMNIYRPEETGALVFNLDESGTIVSSFDKAVNIRVSDRRLVSIVRHAAAMTPMSIHCPALLDRKDIRLRIGQAVTFADGMLGADGWRMDGRSAKRFEGYPTVEKPFGMNVRKLDLFEKILHFLGQKDGLLGITRDGQPRNSIVRRGQEIVEKIMSHDRAHIARHLAELTGLGPGFTPAGDDLISGFLVGETLALREHRLFSDVSTFTLRSMSDRNEKTVLWTAAKGTNDAGRTLIWMALTGRFPRFLCLAVAALNRAETAKDMLTMVTNAIRFGHTSGTDALTGMLLYFKTCLRHLLHNRRRLNTPTDVHPKQTSISG